MSKKKINSSVFRSDISGLHTRYSRILAYTDKEKSKEIREQTIAEKLEKEGIKKHHCDGLIYRFFASYGMLETPKDILKSDDDIKSFKYGYFNIGNLQLDLLASNTIKNNGIPYMSESIINILENIIVTGKTQNSKGRKYSAKEKIFIKSIKKLINPILPTSKDEREKAIEERTKNINNLLYRIGRNDAINNIVIPSDKYPSITNNESYLKGFNSLLEEENNKHKHR